MDWFNSAIIKSSTFRSIINDDTIVNQTGMGVPTDVEHEKLAIDRVLITSFIVGYGIEVKVHAITTYSPKSSLNICI